jgi:hypothetical protein
VPDELEESDSSSPDVVWADGEAHSSAAQIEGTQGQLLVEFETVGFRETAKTPADLARESAAAVTKAMEAIREMGQRVTATAESMGRPPDSVAVTFGVKLDMEAGALIAKASGGASIQVTLTWSRAQSHPKQGSQ